MNRKTKKGIFETRKLNTGNIRISTKNQTVIQNKFDMESKCFRFQLLLKTIAT